LAAGSKMEGLAEHFGVISGGWQSRIRSIHSQLRKRCGSWPALQRHRFHVDTDGTRVIAPLPNAEDWSSRDEERPKDDPKVEASLEELGTPRSGLVPPWIGSGFGECGRRT